jgi:pyrroloquinoline quinone biosynthesis protein B
VLPDKRVYLVDATPDIRVQIDALADVRSAPEGRVDRAPVAGVLLTHAHMGHYTGLAWFGFEAVSSQNLTVLCSPRMATFLRSNGPWDQLVRYANISLSELDPERPFSFDHGVTVTSFAVPHRDEYSDTLAFLFRGPRSSLLYVPDTDSWARWSRPLPEVLAGVDVALLDGTFYSLNELPGRDVGQIGHPLMSATMDLLDPLVRSGKTRVFFTHLNHSNPTLDPASPERADMQRRGFYVVDEGQEFAL